MCFGFLFPRNGDLWLLAVPTAPLSLGLCIPVQQKHKYLAIGISDFSQTFYFSFRKPVMEQKIN